MVAPSGAIAGYTLGPLIGRGGWALVYRAQGPDGRAVALKVLDAEHRRYQTRLQREFDFAHRLRHPNIVTVYESGAGWLAMELIDGGTAGTLASDRAAALTVLAQVARALDYAHRCGIVHCDVKPSNILVARPPDEPLRAVLTDFGVAHSVSEDVAMRLAHDTGRLTLDPARRISQRHWEQRPRVHASLAYSAPELLSGRAPTAATDEYSLACTVVELLTGAPPFSACDADEMIEHHLHSAPPRISRTHTAIPRTVDAILARAMAKQPDVRYHSCAEFVGLITKAFR